MLRWLRWGFTIISCIIFILGSIKSIDQPISDSEIRAIGTGFEIFYNLEAPEKFAILEPPLSGIISYTLLKNLYSLGDISYIPSGNYFGLLAFMFALETPKIIGSQILANIGEKNFKNLRYINLIWIAMILYLVSRENIILGGILMLFLYPFQDRMMTSMTQTLSILLILLVLALMNATIKRMSYFHCIMLGVVIGLLIALSGSDGILFAGMAIVSVIIWHDIEKKKLSKGFKKQYLLGYLKACFTAMFILWICYGMDLVCFCQLQSLLGFTPTNSMRIVPFFDSIKQVVFEVLFPMYEHQYSFIGNISEFFNPYNTIITILNLFLGIKIQNQNRVFSIVLIASICLYNNSNPAKIDNFFQITSMILVILNTLQIGKLVK
jgi:hypothetical protein